MGYDVHITRAGHWIEESQNPISLEEWKGLIEVDKDMALTGAAYVTTPEGDRIGYENEGLAVWKNSEQDEVWFDYRDNQIAVKNPDEEILMKMCEIAKKLNARVIGDDGEEYAALKNKKNKTHVRIIDNSDFKVRKSHSLLERIAHKFKLFKTK